jgi:hypothetical protein
VSASLAFATVLNGCSSPTMAVQVIRYLQAPPAATRSGCAVETIDEGHPLASGCCELGDVFVGDTGWTDPCDRDRVLKEVRAQACTLGGDTVILRPVADDASSCFQVRARVLRCATAATVAR